MSANYAHLADRVLAWRKRHGLTQESVARPGLSRETVRKIESQTWASRSPGGTLSKLDAGMRWGEGVGIKVLMEGFDPLDESVGTTLQDASYVSSQGATVESGITNEDLLREILRNRSEYDRLEAKVEQGLRELSERIDRLEPGP